MDKNRIKGSAKKAEGTVKELVGNPTLEAEGKIEKAEGRLQNSYGKARDALRKG